MLTMNGGAVFHATCLHISQTTLGRRVSGAAFTSASWFQNDETL